MKSLKLFLFAFTLICSGLFSQTGEYFIQNYLPHDYNFGPNNNGVTQDKAGRIFVAGQNGVLVFDGINWQIIALENQTSIYSIAADESGTIYVGAEEGEFGYIDAGSNGKFIYHSLKNKIPKADQPNEAIKHIITNKGRIFFLSADKLIVCENGNVKCFSPKNKFHIRAFVLGNHLFITDLNTGVFAYSGNKLIQLENDNGISSDKPFFCYYYKQDSAVIGLRNNGLYKVFYNPIEPNKTTFQKLQSPLDFELTQNEINNGCQLSNGNFVITTNKKGALIIDNKFNVVKRLNTKNGIYEDNVKSAFEDKNNNLWLATYYGVSYIELNSNLNKYERKNGISGLVTGATFYNNSLYIGTDKGIQFIKNNEFEFQNLTGFNKQTWNLTKINNMLVISTDKGLFSYDGTNITEINDKRTFCVYEDPFNKSLIYTGTDEGVDLFHVSNGKFTYFKSYTLDYPIKSIASDKYRNIYFGSENGIYYLNYYNSYLLDSIQTQDGMPVKNGENYVFTLKNDLLIGTDSGIYAVKKGPTARFIAEKSKKLYPLTKGTQIFRAAELDGDVICTQSFENKKLNKIEIRIVYIAKEFGYIVNRGITGKLRNIKANLITYDSLTKSTFICADEGLFIINKNKPKTSKNYNFFLSALINQNDTLLHNISADNNNLINKNKIVIPYSKNQITLILGYNCFEDKKAVEFAYYIEGSSEKDYGVWMQNNAIYLPNLKEGNYVIHIKARSEINEEVLKIDIPFSIPPPFYRTIWAYIFYIILFILFLYLILRLNSRRLIKKNIALETIIKNRTTTIQEQMALLESQKKLIEHKQTEIIDSINYAKRIQYTLLAHDEFLKSNLPSHFVLFNPKDIVSGDFYWATRLNDKFYLAVCDSTGHGVPGAFMSLLNIGFLSEAINEKNIEKPNEVFDYVRKRLTTSVSKDGQRDGFDGILICVDLKTNQITYSAANNSPVIISNNSFEELSSDRMPVGIGERKDEFKLFTINAKAGDTLYLYTDGYADQFGGPKGKKFKYKQLNELLVSISHLSMNEQKHKLDTVFENWKGNLEQVDDVCVIGIRV